MRVSTNMQVEQMITNLQRNSERLLDQQEKVSTGKRLRRPSDDPAATERSLRIRSQLINLEQHQRSIDASQTWLATTDKGLENAGDILQRVRELTVRARTATMTAADRRAVGLEVDELLKSLVEVSNTQLAGRYIFAGFKTTAAAYTATFNGSGQVTNATYNGDTNQILQNIDDGVNIPINVTGDFFAPIFTRLISIRDALQAGTAPTDSDFNDLDVRLETVNNLRARVGAVTNRVDQTSDRLGQLKVSLSELLSKAEDLDMAEAVMQFNTQQAVYQAALGTAARVIQPSLLDFLR